MRVLSLFDGISCARVALDRANLPVTTYFASEIDPHAIVISTKNYPDIVRLGDVRQVSGLTDIDLLIGGSPCQDLSIAKQGRKGLDGEAPVRGTNPRLVLQGRLSHQHQLCQVCSRQSQDPPLQ